MGFLLCFEFGGLLWVGGFFVLFVYFFLFLLEIYLLCFPLPWLLNARATNVFWYKEKLKIWIGCGISCIFSKKVISCQYAVSVALLEWKKNFGFRSEMNKNPVNWNQIAICDKIRAAMYYRKSKMSLTLKHFTELSSNDKHDSLVDHTHTAVWEPSLMML